MSENKNEKVKFEAHEKRAFWLIGLAVILFLVLVLGGIILLRIARNALNDASNLSGDILNLSNANQNYTTDEDGERKNVSEGVVDAEFEIGSRRFSHFNIREYAGRTTVDASVENLTEETLPESNFLITFLDESGEALEKIVVRVGAIEPNGMEMLFTTLEEDLVNAESIDVQEIVNENLVSE